MPNEILVILLGSLLILGASIGTRYFLMRRSSSPSVTRIVVAIIAGFAISLLLLLMAGAELDTALFFSGSLAFVISAYLFVRNRLFR